jgi:hypothetical protein
MQNATTCEDSAPAVISVVCTRVLWKTYWTWVMCGTVPQTRILSIDRHFRGGGTPTSDVMAFGSKPL